LKPQESAAVPAFAIDLGERAAALAQQLGGSPAGPAIATGGV